MCVVYDGFANLFVTDHLRGLLAVSGIGVFTSFQVNLVSYANGGGVSQVLYPEGVREVCSAALRPWTPDLESDGTGSGDGEEG